MDILEKSCHIGSCSMFRYENPADDGKHKQTLFVVHDNNGTDSNAMGWLVVCGEWELGSLPHAASLLKEKILCMPESAKSTSAGDSLVTMQTILDGSSWKLYVDFSDFYPATVSQGRPGRWRFYPKKLQTVVDALECFESIADSEDRYVDCEPYRWFIPEGSYMWGESAQLELNPGHFALIDNTIAAFDKGSDEACQVFVKVLKHHKNLITSNKDFVPKRPAWQTRSYRTYR